MTRAAGIEVRQPVAGLVVEEIHPAELRPEDQGLAEAVVEVVPGLLRVCPLDGARGRTEADQPRGQGSTLSRKLKKQQRSPFRNHKQTECTPKCKHFFAPVFVFGLHVYHACHGPENCLHGEFCIPARRSAGGR